MKHLKPSPYFSITALIFIIVAAMSAYRAVNGLSATLGSWEVPMWLSWVAVIVGLYLAWSGYKNSQK